MTIQTTLHTDVDISFSSNPLAVRNALAKTLISLDHMHLSSEEVGTVELVLAEVLNNVVEHAYAGNPGGIIQLKITATKNGLLCSVIDHGHPMPDGHVPMGDRALLDCELDALPEGGFGWFLIRDLARDLEYQRHAEHNHLKFRISVGCADVSG